MDRAFYDLEAELRGQVLFTKLDLDSDDGKAAAKQFRLQKPPLSVLMDSGGRTVEQFEGAKSATEMKTKLLALLKQR